MRLAVVVFMCTKETADVVFADLNKKTKQNHSSACSSKFLDPLFQTSERTSHFSYQHSSFQHTEMTLFIPIGGKCFAKHCATNFSR